MRLNRRNTWFILVIVVLAVVNIGVIAWRTSQKPLPSAGEADAIAKVTSIESQLLENEYRIIDSSSNAQVPTVVVGGHDRDANKVRRTKSVVLVYTKLNDVETKAGTTLEGELRLIENDSNRSASIYEETQKALSSVIWGADGRYKESPVNMESRVKYEVDSRGAKRYLVRETKTNGLLDTSVYYNVAHLQFPNKPIAIGEKWEAVGQVPSDAPQNVKENPPRVTLKCLKRVLFEDQPAILVEGTVVEYMVPRFGKIVLGSGPMKMSSTIRAYVSIASGQAIWIATDTVCNLPAVEGVKTGETRTIERKIIQE